jgi:hypothetical protein
MTDNKMKFKPLFLDEQLFEYVPPLNRTNLRDLVNPYTLAKKVIETLCYDSPGRIILEKQMIERTEFPITSWTQFDQTKVVLILKAIQEAFWWPNHNFLPQDILRYVFYESRFYGYGYFDFRNDMYDMFSCVLPQQINEENCLGDFVRYVCDYIA